jgi:hypothetical protein
MSSEPRRFEDSGPNDHRLKYRRRIAGSVATPARIAFFGNFGTQNLGNEYTLKSIHAARTGPECVADALMK